MPDSPARLRAPRSDEIVIDIRRVVKDYRALRPLRIASLQVRAGESIALLGLDLGAAEVFVNLVTAATLPDEGDVRVFGAPTSSIQTPDAWLGVLDRFGIVGERAVVLDELSIEDNLIMPNTLALHDVDEATRREACELAAEVGLGATNLGRPVAQLDAAARVRLRLGRALAPRPQVVLAEHPNATLAGDALTAFADDYARIMSERGLTSVVLTADPKFAAAVATRVLTLQPATGELKQRTAWLRWFS